MLENKIKKMKSQLDQMILTETMDSKRLLAHSQALDRMIVEFMKRKAVQPHKITGGRSLTEEDLSNSNKGSSYDIQQHGDINDRQHDDFLCGQHTRHHPEDYLGRQLDDSLVRQQKNSIARQQGDITDYNIAQDLILVPMKIG